MVRRKLLISWGILRAVGGRRRPTGGAAGVRLVLLVAHTQKDFSFIIRLSGCATVHAEDIVVQMRLVFLLKQLYLCSDVSDVRALLLKKKITLAGLLTRQ